MEYLKEIGKTGIKPVVLEEIINFAQKYQIKQVILFGSRARGDFYRASDIDLAVHGGNVIGFTLAAREETSTLLDFDVVDLDKSVDKNFSIPIVSISSISIPSTPLEPLLAFTRFHASESTSSRYNKGNTAYSGIPLLYFTSSAYVCKLKSYHIPARSPSLHYKFFQ